jgi:hypothetical protein
MGYKLTALLDVNVKVEEEFVWDDKPNNPKHVEVASKLKFTLKLLKKVNLFVIAS